MKIKRHQMSKRFDKYLEQATDSTLVEPNWDAIIACFDSIRGNEVGAKPALASIRRRFLHENPHVVMHTLLVLDACVKNCGHRVHAEIATREFMEDFKDLVTENKYDEVKNKALEMLQCWATAFANKQEYKMIVDTHNLMKLAGFDFPSLKEADAMFMAQVAPEWQDGPECYRCRVSFSLLTRKHHCRACGQIFCDKCSSKEMTLPQFGIEKEVRVCESCFESRVASEMSKREKEVTVATSAAAAKTKQADVSAAEKEKLLQEKEEEDLALALAISKSEAEAKEKESERNRHMVSMYNGAAGNEQQDGASLSSYNFSENGIYKGVAAPSVVSDSPAESCLAPDDPLARYLNRDYWQQRKDGSNAKVEAWAAAGASAPPPSEPSIAPSVCSTLMAPDDNTLNVDLAALNLQSGTQNAAYSDDVKAQTEATLKWVESIREQVTTMDNRIRSNVARGRPVFNDTAIQDLFSKLTELHSHVLSRMHTLDDKRVYYESLQDHLANIGEARSAINELREEHERKRQERLAEEQRQRQAQMQQTLEMMRMKKHAMLLEQREQALHKFQQQQQEMAMRRAQQVYYPPGVGGYSPQIQQHQPQQQPQQQQHHPAPTSSYYGYNGSPAYGMQGIPQTQSYGYSSSPIAGAQPPAQNNMQYYTPQNAPVSNGAAEVAQHHQNVQQNQYSQVPTTEQQSHAAQQVPYNNYQSQQHQNYYQQQQQTFNQAGYVAAQQPIPQQSQPNTFPANQQQQQQQMAREYPSHNAAQGNFAGNEYGSISQQQTAEQPLISFD